MALSTQAQRLSAFAQQVGQDVRVLSAKQTQFAEALDTLAKAPRLAQTDVDNAVDTAIQALRNELLGGDVSADLDTLRELGEKLQALENDDSVKGALLTKFTELREEMDALVPANLADIYTQAKQGA